MRNSANDPRTVLGGAASYMEVAARLREFEREFEGKEQVAVDSFANALEQVAIALITNYGLSWSRVLPELRSYHARGVHTMGVAEGGCMDMDARGVRELAYTAKTVIARAYEVTALLLRIDDYFYVKELPLVHKQE
jgi:archaeal chaperonin